MALSIADTTTYSSNDVALSSHNLNLPPNISSGDLLLLFVMVHNQTITDLSGWDVLHSAIGSGTDRSRIYAKEATGSEGSTVTLSLSGTSRASCNAYRITGWSGDLTSSGIAISSLVAASTLTPNPPNLTPSWGSAENLWFAIDWYTDSNTTFTPPGAYPTNYGLGQLFVKNGAGSSGQLLATAARLLTATSEDPGVFTHTGAAKDSDAQTIAIRPGAADPAVFVGTATATFAQTGALGAASSHGGTATTAFSQTGALASRSAFASTAALTFSQTGALAAASNHVGTSAVIFAQTGAFGAGSTEVGNTAITFSQSGNFSAGTVGDAIFSGTTNVLFDQIGDLKSATSPVGTATLVFAQTGVFSARATFVGTTPVVFDQSGNFVAAPFDPNPTAKSAILLCGI